MTIGLTGPGGAGKTQACQVFAEHGYHIINADEVSREVTVSGSDCLNEIISEFGRQFLDGHGNLLRRELGLHIFGSTERVAALNRITHPHIINRIKERMSAADNVVIDAPTLFESGADILCDKIISIIADKELRSQRVTKRDGIDDRQAMARFMSQHEDDYYIMRSDIVIYNNRGREEFREELIKELESGILG
ncbi:MAG: dephospho-CoA kinase [Oscillospiraceae bacterium]|nr:dephospho-CoA kinase [Oscillospiraceae bacterium]